MKKAQKPKFTIIADKPEFEIKVLERRLARLRKMAENRRIKHDETASKAKSLTYYDGYDLGLIEGKASAFAEIVDEMLKAQ